MAKIRTLMAVLFSPLFVVGILVAFMGCAVMPAPSGQSLLSTAPRIELPYGESLFSFAKQSLVPYFDKVSKEEVPVPEDINTSLLDILSPSYRAQRAFWLGINNEYQPKGPTKDPFSEIRGKTILLNRSAVALKGESLGVRDSNQSRVLATIIKYPLFQLQRILWIVSPWSSAEFLTIPINRNNLRIFVGTKGGNFRDPSYINYCAKLQTMERPEFFSAWAYTLLNGFNPNILDQLTEEEREVLFETAGIYIGESFKRIRLVGVRGGAEHISGENIGSLALISSFLGQRGSSFARANCTYFEKNFRARIPLRKNFEREILAYLKLRHPTLLPKTPGVEGEGVFDSLYGSVEAPRILREREFQRYDQIIRLLAVERTQIAKFINSRGSILKFRNSEQISTPGR